MLKIKKKNKILNKNKEFFFICFFCNIKIFFIDKIFIIPFNIKINKKKNKIYLKSFLGKLNYIFSKNLIFFINFNKILLIFKKKINFNIYDNLIKMKIKGILHGFKKILILQGLGFKFFIENNKNLIFKLGFSHNIIIKIPKNIKINNQKNKLIFYSIDYIYLLKFIFFLKNLKKKNIFKKTGLLLQHNEILKKKKKKK